MKKWEILSKLKVKSEKFKIEDVIKVLLENRGIRTKKEIDKFLNPKLDEVTIEDVGIDKKQIKKAIRRIQTAIEKEEQIIVYGDYDVDGICGTAILWETLHALGAKVTPYIPHRIDEGYGLSTKGISNFQLSIPNTKLIVTVDNGIVANEAVEFANNQGIDVIITDHHVPSKKKPDALTIVHTTKLCGAGVAYLLSQNIKYQRSNIKYDEREHLELVALATVADLVPLKEANRTLLRYGLEELCKTKRVGLIELFKEAVINPQEIDVYKIGHVIAPRLNAMGRLDYAMDSLRLLCTKNSQRAEKLAKILGETNRERQQLTLESATHAIAGIKNSHFAKASRDKQSSKLGKLLFIADETYQQGVIGLVAGKLVEEYYRPAIVVSKGEIYSKASARSVSGFNIIEFIRGASEFLVDAGGHPMAAGFTFETSKLADLQKFFEGKAEELLDDEKLTRVLRIDCEIPLDIVGNNFYCEIQKLLPFGMGNPEPVFVSRNLIIGDIRVVGKEGKHVKFKVFSCHLFEPEPQSRRPELDSGSQKETRSRNEFGMTNKVGHDKIYEGIAFGIGERAGEFKAGDRVNIVYSIDENVWNGNKSLQLKIKDIRKS